jgi:hypothetical protein
MTVSARPKPPRPATVRMVASWCAARRNCSDDPFAFRPLPYPFRPPHSRVALMIRTLRPSRHDGVTGASGGQEIALA